MRKIFILSAIIILTFSEAFAYDIKLYDEYGNRIGTYKKVGDSYQLYDFNDMLVENPDQIIQDAPDKRTLTEYSQTFYDENMVPVGTWHSGYYGNDGRYYPRHGVFYPAPFHKTRTPYVVRPHAKTEKGIYKYSSYQNNVNYVDTRYPKLEKFIPYQ